MHREHREYLQTVINQISFVKRISETNELINKIDRYISDHESRQLELLKDLAILSKNVYGFDKTIEKYSENIELFQSFFSTKNQLNVVSEQLIEEERKKESTELAAEELKRNQEIQEQQKSKQMVEFAPNRQPQQQQQPKKQQQQILDIKVISTRQTLSLEEAPRFIRCLCDIAVQIGENCQFVCQLQSGFQPALQVEWLKNGNPITISPHYEICNENGLCTLSIKETRTDDSGIFTCRAKNLLGSTETVGKLCVQLNEPTEILHPPNFVKPLKNCKILSESPFIWKCFVEGNPLPTIQWFKNDICIDVSPRHNISFNNGEATLRLDHLTNDDDAGIYTCIAKNIVGVDQCSALLTVTAAPQSTDSLVENG